MRNISTTEIVSKKDVNFIASSQDIEREKIYKLYLKNVNNSQDYEELFQKTIMNLFNNTTSYEDVNKTSEESLRPYSETNFNVANSEAILIILTVIYAIIFVLGVVGNTVTCLVIAKNRSMQTAVNFYLFSLAISDLFLLILGLYV